MYTFFRAEVDVRCACTEFDRDSYFNIGASSTSEAVEKAREQSLLKKGDVINCHKIDRVWIYAYPV